MARDRSTRTVLEEDTHVALDVVALDAQVAHDVPVREGLEAAHLALERLGGVQCTLGGRGHAAVRDLLDGHELASARVQPEEDLVRVRIRVRVRVSLA